MAYRERMNTLQSIIETAWRIGATDIHLEGEVHSVTVRYRVRAMLLRQPLAERLELIDWRRAAGDGAVLAVGERRLRLSALPVSAGREHLVLRFVA